MTQVQIEIILIASAVAASCSLIGSFLVLRWFGQPGLHFNFLQRTQARDVRRRFGRGSGIFSGSHSLFPDDLSFGDRGCVV